MAHVPGMAHLISDFEALHARRRAESLAVRRRREDTGSTISVCRLPKSAAGRHRETRCGPWPGLIVPSEE